MTVNIDSYKRKDGTKVRKHKRKDPNFPELKFKQTDLDKVDYDKSAATKAASDSSLASIFDQGKAELAKKNPLSAARDLTHSNQNTYKLSAEGLKRWKKNSDRSDLEGVDTPAQDGRIDKPKAKFLETYKGYKIQDNQGQIEVVNGEGDIFVVGLDDSKSSGSREFVDSANNVKTARNYIDWLTRDSLGKNTYEYREERDKFMKAVNSMVEIKYKNLAREIMRKAQEIVDSSSSSFSQYDKDVVNRKLKQYPNIAGRSDYVGVLNQVSRLQAQGKISLDQIDWESVPSDIDVEEWLSNEYGVQ